MLKATNERQSEYPINTVLAMRAVSCSDVRAAEHQVKEAKRQVTENCMYAHHCRRMNRIYTGPIHEYCSVCTTWIIFYSHEICRHCCFYRWHNCWAALDGDSVVVLPHSLPRPGALWLLFGNRDLSWSIHILPSMLCVCVCARTRTSSVLPIRYSYGMNKTPNINW